MQAHVALDQLIDLEERAARLYTGFFRQFADLPALATLWWGMALEEHEHAGILKMIKQIASPRGKVPGIRDRLRPLQATIRVCERQASRNINLRQALAMAVRLERSELDRLGRDTVRAISVELPSIPPSAFAPHEAHLERLMRTVRKFGGEEVAREAWNLRPEARVQPVASGAGAVARQLKTRGPMPRQGRATRPRTER